MPPEVALPDYDRLIRAPLENLLTRNNRICQRPHRQAFKYPWYPTRPIHPQWIPRSSRSFHFFRVSLHGSLSARDPLLCSAFLLALMMGWPLSKSLSSLVKDIYFAPFNGMFALCSRSFRSSRFSADPPISCAFGGSPTPAVYCTACYTTISAPTDSAGLPSPSSTGPTPFVATYRAVNPCSSPDLAPSPERPMTLRLTSSMALTYSF